MTTPSGIPNSPATPGGIELTLTHDGMTVRPPASRLWTSLVVLAVFLALIVRVLSTVGDATSWLGLVFCTQFVLFWIGSLLALWPRRIAIRGDWLTLHGIGTTRLRLAEVEDIRMWGTSLIVFEMHVGRRHRLYVRSAFTEEGQRWLLAALREAVRQARTKDEQRAALDESSRRALSGLRQQATSEQ